MVKGGLLSASGFQRLETVKEEFKFKLKEKCRGAQEEHMGCGALRVTRNRGAGLKLFT
jgi:hypothetical protein